MARKPDKKEEVKCVAVHLPVSLVKQLDAFKAKTGKSKNTILVEFIQEGLCTNAKGEQ
jgi:predicted DNA-binding protein